MNNKLIKNIFTYTLSGIKDINDLSQYDQIFTVKGRFQPIEKLYYRPIIKYVTSKESLQVPLTEYQSIYLQKDSDNPKFIPPKEKNHDKRDSDFWFMVGFLLKNTQDINLFQLDSELYYFVKRLGSIYSPQFNLPINILTLPRNKLDAFLNGLNLDSNDIKQLNRKTRLSIVTLLQQLKYSFSSNNSLSLSPVTSKYNPNPNTFVRCIKVADGGYYLNGLYLLNP